MLYNLNSNAWEPLATNGFVPGHRKGHSLVTMETGDNKDVIVFGGFYFNKYCDASLRVFKADRDFYNVWKNNERFKLI